MMYKMTLDIPPATPVYDIHRDVMALFAGIKPRVLWRRDGDMVTVVSDMPPTAAVDYAEETPAFEVGKKYRFKIRVNPTVKRNGKRYLTPSVHAWLDGKAARHGFTVENVTRLTDEGRFTAKNGARLPSFDIAGVLTVMDDVAFRRTLIAGIGSQKAWGFGLLLVK
jgi:CRISPR-associated protein Cas6/Cse3/CasE subtype I-E